MKLAGCTTRCEQDLLLELINHSHSMNSIMTMHDPGEMAGGVGSGSPVGVIGLGLMGTVLARRLLDGGYQVVVHNRTRAKAAPLLAAGARWSDNPLEQCGRVLISLYTTATVEEVLTKLGQALRPGHLLIDTTTGSPQETSRLAASLAERGVAYVDAPLSGSSEQTLRGEATALVGAGDDAFAACRDLLERIAGTTIRTGPPGSGAQMKLVSNLVLGLNRAALAEGLAFAEALGLDAEATLGVLRNTPAYSRTMDNKGDKMVQRDFSVQARLSQHLKDVGLMIAAAQARGRRLPLSETHQSLLEAAEQLGLGDADNSAIIEAIRGLLCADEPPALTWHES